MAAVAAEADGEPVFGQVVGVGQEPGPLMDARVLRRLCGMLDVPAAGSLADQATACRAALLGEPGLTTTAPEVVQGVVTEQPGANAGTRGTIESLGRWNEKEHDRAMPLKFEVVNDRDGTGVRLAFSKFVDVLVQTFNASSGILAISNRKEMRGGNEFSILKVSWSAIGTSYQRHGAPDEAARLRAEAKKKGKEPLKIRFADFEGAVEDMGDDYKMAVYRVTLPSGGLDPNKWVGRPPPPAPADLYTGPRSDGLLSTEEISGDYSAACICAGACPMICNSMTVVPHGPDAIETWSEGCVFFPLVVPSPVAEGAVWTRNPGTDAFLNPHGFPISNLMTFSADGTAKRGCCCGYKKRPDSQKRAFHKVETRDLAGRWCGCACLPLVLYFVVGCITKRALNEDQYDECGLCLISSICGTRTRKYVNGHPTNGFVRDGGKPDDPCAPIHWYRDPGCAGDCTFFAKKLC